MNLNNRLEKLRQQQKLVVEALRQAEAKASTRQRKRDTRAKITLGAVVLSMTGDEREALLSMLLPHMSERDRGFISDHLTGNQSTEPEAPSVLN